MAQLPLESGTWFLIDTMPMTIINCEHENYLLVSNEGQHIYKTQKQLEQLFFEGRISTSLPKNTFEPRKTKTKVASLKVMSKEQEVRAKFRRDLIKEVKGTPYNKVIFDKMISNYFRNNPNCNFPKPSSITVYRWIKRWEKSGYDIEGLQDKHGRGCYERWPQITIDLCRKSIDYIYLNRNKNSIQKTLNYAKSLIDQENELKRINMLKLKPPSRALIKRLVNEINEFDINIAREGLFRARNIHRGKSGNVEEIRFRDYAEVDSTPINVMLLDNNTNALLGRGWITTLIEKVSKYPLGIYIGYTPPSCLTIAECLKHSILPKLSLSLDFPHIENGWDGYGVVGTIIMDNALENHSKSIESMILTLNVDVVLCGKKSPWQKSNIEGYLKVVANDAMNIISGTTFNNIFEKNDYNSDYYAVMTIGEFKSHILKWIVDVYMQKPQPSLNDVSPGTMWKLLNEKEIPIFETRALDLDIVLGRVDSRRITHKGFYWNGLQYSSEELRILREIHDFKQSVEIRINELDLSHIWVKIPGSKGSKESDFIKVPAVNQNYTSNLSAYLHEINKAWSKKYHYQEDESGWLKASADIYDVIASLPIVKNKSSAKAASRILEQLDPKKISSALKTPIKIDKPFQPRVYYPIIPDEELRDFEITTHNARNHHDT